MKRVLAAVPVALFFATVFVFGCFRLIDTDLWLYLRVGERICRTMEVPRADIFSYSAAGRTWVDVHWLAQAGLWLVYRAGGATGLCLLRAALILAIFALLYRCCRLSAPPALACAVLTLALLVSADGFLMKPQLLALLLAVVFSVSLERDGPTPWLLVPLQALWVNAHPSFPIGPALVAVYGADALLTRRPPRRRYGLLLAACAAACLATPYGPAVLAQPWRQVGSRLFGGTVIPWTPPSSAFPASISFACFKVMLALCALGFVLNARGIRPAHLAIAAVFAALSFRSRRHLPFFALLSAPGLAFNLGAAAERLRARAPAAFRLLAPAGAGLLSAFLLLLARDAVTGELYFRQRSLKRFGLGKSSEAYPDAAIDFISSRGAPGRLFCNYDVGSYVAARLHPAAAVFIDGRNLVYGEPLFRRYLDAMGDIRQFDALAAEYGISTLLLSHSARDVKALLPALRKSPRWRPVYADDRAAVFVREGEAPSLPRLDLSRCALAGVPSQGPFPLAELRGGEFFFAAGEDGCARSLFLDALSRRADLPEAHNFLGAIAARRGDLAGAEEEFRRACAGSRRYAEPHANLSEVLRARDDCAGAEEEASAAVRIAPASPPAREALGLALLCRGDLTRARRELEEAVRLDPRGAEYRSNLGVLRERAGDAAGAEEEYARACALAPDYFAPRFNLALLLQKRGAGEAAVALYEQALAINPGHAAARRNLAALRSRRAAQNKTAAGTY